MSCPPDVSPKTRIIAVCGITDIGDRASPISDGWLLSDFWMFNHLFRETPVANQIWLTCCSPKLLVDKYGMYAHGNPVGERRTVLEERLLGSIEAARTWRVVEPKVLLECFLKTVEDECKAAVNANQDVLLLVFGHGDENSYGVTIGSNSNSEFKELSAPRLQVSQLKAVSGKKTPCELLSTSRYSGGWAMQPDLNSTIITAAGPDARRQSWHTVSSSRGFSGPMLVSAIRDAILTSEIEDEENTGEPGITYQELSTTETYAEIGGLIHDHLKQSDRFHSEHEISFAAQDDEWTRAWRERTGIPLTFLKQRWEELSILPAHTESPSQSATCSGSMTPLSPTMTAPQMYNIVRALAAGYANSFPGPDNLSINTTFHTSVRLLLTGQERSENRVDALLTLGYTLSYRLEAMTMASYYKDFLGLDYPDCTSCSIEAWTYPLHDSVQEEAKEKVSRFRKTTSLLNAAKIFSAPSEGQGYGYIKPRQYLAIALVESGKTSDEIEQAIGMLKDGKSLFVHRPSNATDNEIVHSAILAPQVEAVRRAPWFRDRAGQILKPVKKRLRSVSPRKRKSVCTAD